MDLFFYIMFTLIGITMLLMILYAVNVKIPSDAKAITLIPLSGDTQGIEVILADYRQSFCEGSWPPPSKLIIVDNGMSEESHRICELFCRDNSQFEILFTDELTERIKKSIE